MLKKSSKILRDLQYSNGLISAARKEVKTGYNRAWIRDNIYASLGLELTDLPRAVMAIHALLDIIKKHKYKICWMIQQPEPKEKYRYIHARYDPETLDEIYEDWGNKQNDAVGALLFRIGELHKKGLRVLRDKEDLESVQLLVNYLKAIEYWHDPDNGMWEENEEVHASSIGACAAGLNAVKGIVNVPSEMIKKGREVLNKLLPRESETKKVDLALLSLIYPYNVVSEEQAQQILENVEQQLVREKGVIRYKGDKYYNKNGEAEWCMGLPWIAIIHKKLGNIEKYKHYLSKSYSALNERGEMPELYYAGTEEYNENTPLGWAQSLLIVAMES